MLNNFLVILCAAASPRRHVQHIAPTYTSTLRFHTLINMYRYWNMPNTVSVFSNESFSRLWLSTVEALRDQVLGHAKFWRGFQALPFIPVTVCLCTSRLSVYVSSVYVRFVCLPTAQWRHQRICEIYILITVALNESVFCSVSETSDSAFCVLQKKSSFQWYEKESFSLQ